MLFATRWMRWGLLVSLLSLTSFAWAQHGGGPPGGGGGGGMPGGGGAPPMGGGGMGGGPDFPANRGPNDYSHGNGGPPPGGAPDSAGTVSTMRGGLQLGPPGRWWDDKHFAKDLRLRTDQQRRMDSLFEQNRPSLLRRYEALQQEQGRMEALTRARSLDEASLFAQIDRVAQARAELEKANTHYLLQIRGEMDADQIARLEQHR